MDSSNTVKVESFSRDETLFMQESLGKWQSLVRYTA